MTEEKDLTNTVDMDESITVVQETMDKFLGAANVNAVYGEPVQKNDNLIIPTAEVVSLAGFGVGSGYAFSEEQEGGEKNVSGGGGGGGGGRVLSRPVAVIIASPDGVRVEPVVDPTKIALAFFTTLGFMVGMIARMLRR